MIKDSSVAQTSKPNSPHAIAIALVCLSIVIGIFSPVLAGDFLLWDDLYHIARNPFFSVAESYHLWTEPYFGLYVPLSYSIWFTIWNWISQSPLAFHLLNLVVHAANGYLLYRLLHRVQKFSFVPAFLGALLFLLHPLQVEAVAWISDARSLLATFFALLALQAWLQPIKHWRQTVFILVAFIFSLLCKPTGVVLPLAVLLLFFLQGRLQGSEKVSPSARSQFLIVSVACLIVAVLIALLTYVSQAPETIAVFSFLDRVLLAGDSLGWFLRKLVWPLPLVMDYGRSASLVLSERLWIESLILIAVADVVLLAAFWKLRLHRNFLFWTAMVLAVAWWLPNSGVLSSFLQDFSLVADRYYYGAMVGVAMLAAMILQASTPLRWVFSALLLVCAALSFRQSRVWVSDESLFSHTLEVNPRSLFALSNLGQSYVNAGRPTLAIPLLQGAHSLYPDEAGPILGLMSAFGKLEDHEQVVTLARTFLSRQRAVELNRHSPLLFEIIAVAGYSLTQLEQWDAAYQFFCQGLKFNPLARFDQKSLQNLHAVEEKLKQLKKEYQPCE